MSISEPSEPNWITASERVPVSAAAARLPREPGLYAFFVDDPRHLPEPFGSMLAARADRHLLYIGQASGSLYERVWEQECRHRKPGTLFRSVGVVLGYVSPSGGPNFEFMPDHKDRIAAWMAGHLAVAWTTRFVHMCCEEKAAIRRHQPLLNLRYNPQRSADLIRLRARSRRVSRVEDLAARKPEV